MPAITVDPYADVDIDPNMVEPRLLPPYAVIILDDDKHSFEYVVGVIMKVFKYSAEKSFSLTKEIHEEGRAIVWTGQLEVAELKRDQIVSVAKDCTGKNPVNFPLGVVLEPIA